MPRGLDHGHRGRRNGDEAAHHEDPLDAMLLERCPRFGMQAAGAGEHDRNRGRAAEGRHGHGVGESLAGGHDRTPAAVELADGTRGERGGDLAGGLVAVTTRDAADPQPVARQLGLDRLRDDARATHDDDPGSAEPVEGGEQARRQCVGLGEEERRPEPAAEVVGAQGIGVGSGRGPTGPPERSRRSSRRRREPWRSGRPGETLPLDCQSRPCRAGQNAGDEGQHRRGGPDTDEPAHRARLPARAGTPPGPVGHGQPSSGFVGITAGSAAAVSVLFEAELFEVLPVGPLTFPLSLVPLPWASCAWKLPPVSLPATSRTT